MCSALLRYYPKQPNKAKQIDILLFIMPSNQITLYVTFIIETFAFFHGTTYLSSKYVHSACVACSLGKIVTHRV